MWLIKKFLRGGSFPLYRALLGPTEATIRRRPNPDEQLLREWCMCRERSSCLLRTYIRRRSREKESRWRVCDINTYQMSQLPIVWTETILCLYWNRTKRRTNSQLAHCFPWQMLFLYLYLKMGSPQMSDKTDIARDSHFVTKTSKTMLTTIPRHRRV